MARLMALCAERLTPEGPVGERLFGWQGDLGPSSAPVPLRLAGALHALALTGEARLPAVYPPEAASDGALWAAVSAALSGRAGHVLAWLERAPQTNEVRRAAGLIARGALARRAVRPAHAPFGTGRARGAEPDVRPFRA
jgi:hypothetical protein